MNSSIYNEDCDLKHKSSIISYGRRPCPSDFPKELCHLWQGVLEYSLTPCQVGWNILKEPQYKHIHSHRR